MIVRKLLDSDVEPISQLSESTQELTTVDPYVVWMLSETHGDYCFVVGNQPGTEIYGYLLAFETSQNDEIFVWQLLVLPSRNQRSSSIIDCLFSSLYENAKRNGKKRFKFTASTQSRINRIVKSMNRIVDSLGISAPAVSVEGKTPSEIREMEMIYCVNLNVSTKSVNNNSMHDGPDV